MLICGLAVECEGCQIHCLNCETGNQRLHGFGEDGFFAEYAVVDYRNATILPESMDLRSSAPLFCGGITGAYEAFVLERPTVN